MDQFQFQAHKLKSVKDFSNLRKVRGMWVNRNHELTDLSGFDNIDTSYIRYIVLKENEKLELCNSKFLCSYLDNPKHKASILATPRLQHPAKKSSPPAPPAPMKSTRAPTLQVYS